VNFLPFLKPNPDMKVKVLSGVRWAGGAWKYIETLVLEHVVASDGSTTICGFPADPAYTERSSWVTLVSDATVYRTFA
jgi:hypothetical protein